MDALSALIAEMLAGMRALVAPELCPGGWAWATTALGVGVGLLPAAGALVAARLRAAGAVLGLLTAGVLPWLVLTATGQVFAAAAAGRAVPGLARAEVRELARAECFIGPQAGYLGEGSVAAAFDAGRPLLLGAAVLAFGLLPLLAAAFVAAQARLALRGGPTWPRRLFWLPVLALPFLAADAPAGSSAHLWLGLTIGALAGIVLVVLARPAMGAARRPAGPGAAGPAPRPVSPAPPPRARPGAAAVLSARAAQWRGRATPVVRRWSDQLAARFAAREPVAPVVLPPERVAPVPGNPPRRPTLLLPEQRAAPPRFRVERRLGAGGFGRVWLAHDARLGHLVALKAAHVPDGDTEQRIRREAKALAAVRHPHCVRIHDLVHARSDPGLAELDGLVIVMEYVAGSSLVEHVRDRGVLDDVAAARVWAGLADGLAAVHGRGVLHRDVKPANVVVDAGGTAHLIDFGIARTAGDATLTLAGWILGTPDFLAPEVAGGATATPASDAWQLAATISYAMTGHPPRGGHADAQSGLRAAAAGAPPTHLPKRTAHDALLRAALATDPAARPAPAEVNAALCAWLRRKGRPLSGTTMLR
ncbi:MAG: serine/threonine-protein kinase [Pseudonocardia sp.]